MRQVLLISTMQLVSGKRFWLVLFFAAIPVGVSALVRIVGSDASSVDIHDALTNLLLISALLPLTALLLATSSLGDELDDGTLPLLTLKPISRWEIAIPKLLASVLVGGIPLAMSGWLTSLLITNGDMGQAATTAFALLLGATAYSALFLWAGLALPYALAVGVVYILVWESALSGLLGGSRLLSVRQYTMATVQGLDQGRLIGEDIDMGLTGALIGAGIVITLFLVLTVRRLERMDAGANA